MINEISNKVIQLGEDTSEINRHLIYGVLTLLIVCSFLEWRRRKGAEHKIRAIMIGLERELSEWLKQRNETVRRLKSIAEEICQAKRNCNIAKVVGLCLASTGEITALVSTYCMCNLFLSANAIRFGSRLCETITATVADLRGDFISQQGAKKANKLLQEDDVTFKRLKEKLDEYCSSLKECIESSSGLGDAILRFKVDGDFIEVFIEVGAILKTRIKKFDLRDKQVNRIVSNIVNTSQMLGFNLSPRTALLTSAVSITVDGITIYKLVNDIRNGSPDATADKITEIANNLKEQTYTADVMILEFLLEIANANGLTVETTTN